MNRRKFFGWLGFAPIVVASGAVALPMTPTIDAYGVDSAAVSRLTAGLMRVNASIEARAVAALETQRLAAALSPQVEKFQRDMDTAGSLAASDIAAIEDRFRVASVHIGDRLRPP